MLLDVIIIMVMMVQTNNIIICNTSKYGLMSNNIIWYYECNFVISVNPEKPPPIIRSVFLYYFIELNVWG